MMSERAFWNLVRERLGMFGRLTRIENRLEKGTPDVAYTLKYGAHGVTHSGWIELKHSQHWPARADTMVRIDHLTIEQVTWLEAEEKAGGRAWCLLQAERTYLLLKPAAVRAVYEGILAADLRAAATVRTEHGDGFPTRQILAELTR